MNLTLGLRLKRHRADGTEGLTSSEICDPNVTQVPAARAERFSSELQAGRPAEEHTLLPLHTPTHLSPGRKHVGLTCPGSCGKDQKQTMGKKMAPSVHVGEVWVLRMHLHTQSPVRSNSSLMCASDTYSNSGDPLISFLFILSDINTDEG